MTSLPPEACRLPFLDAATTFQKLLSQSKSRARHLGSSGQHPNVLHPQCRCLTVVMSHPANSSCCHSADLCSSKAALATLIRSSSVCSCSQCSASSTRWSARLRRAALLCTLSKTGLRAIVRMSATTASASECSSSARASGWSPGWDNPCQHAYSNSMDKRSWDAVTTWSD